MAGNALIPLMGKPTELGVHARQGAVTGNILANTIENNQTKPMRMEAAGLEIESAKRKAEMEKSMMQLRSAAIDVAPVMESMKMGDLDSAFRSLNTRNARLLAEGRDNSDTEYALAAIRSGDPDRIRALYNDFETVQRTAQQFGAMEGQQQTDSRTSKQKELESAGIMPGSPEYKQAILGTGGAAEETYSQPQTVIGADGKPQLVRFGNRGGVQPVDGYAPPPKSGMSLITNPDGTVSFSTGGQANTPGVSQSTGNKIEQMIMENDSAYQQLKTIQESYMPELMSDQSAVKAWYLNEKDRKGLLDPNSDDAQFLTDYTNLAAASGKYVAENLRRMSGGAVTPEEAQRQMVYLPDFEQDGKVKFQANLESSMDFLTNANRRLHYAKANGLTQAQMYDIPLDSIPSRIQKRGEQLEAQGWPTGKIRETLRAEFGQ